MGILIVLVLLPCSCLYLVVLVTPQVLRYAVTPIVSWIWEWDIGRSLWIPYPIKKQPLPPVWFTPIWDASFWAVCVSVSGRVQGRFPGFYLGHELVYPKLIKHQRLQPVQHPRLVTIIGIHTYIFGHQYILTFSWILCPFCFAIRQVRQGAGGCCPRWWRW